MKKNSSALAEYLDRYRAALVILSGEARGLEYRLDQPRTALGRGPGVDLALDDASLRRKHAIVEFRSGAFVLCDSEDGASTRGLELKDGDRFRIGDLELGFTQSLREPTQ
jgi:predicted component of type VI protein secretion system